MESNGIEGIEFLKNELVKLEVERKHLNEEVIKLISLNNEIKAINLLLAKYVKDERVVSL